MAAAVAPPRARRNPITLVAPVAFLGLGMTESTWGIAWEPLHEVVGQPVGALGALPICFSLGYLTVTLNHGALVRRLGTGSLLLVSAVAGLLGASIFATTSSWPAVLLAAGVLGLAFGAVDAGLNTYVSIHHGARSVSFMLAGFGVGATAGPLAFSALLAAGWSWRLVYVGLAVLEAGLIVAWALLRHRFLPLPDHDDVPPSVDGSARPDGPDRPAAPPRVGLVLGLSVLLFFTYVGVEQATGNWAFWLFDERGVAADTARWWTTLYWAALASGRFLVGLLSRRFGPAQVLRVGVAGGLVGTFLLWLGGAPAPFGLALAGLSFAGVFPSLIALTPTRLGRARAPRAMGVQLAAASLGAAAVTAAIGLVFARLGGAAIAPALVAGAGVLVVLQAVTARVARPATAAGVPRAT